MKQFYKLLKIIILICFIIQNLFCFAQLNLQTSSIINKVCNGKGCEYSGPSILINEVMLSPSSGDGALYCSDVSGRNGEWIELYNPNECESVDISYYFLGNNARDDDGNFYGGGFMIPANTIIPARGFCIIRGVNATAVDPALLVENGGRTVEIVVNSSTSVCTDFSYRDRLWFPNAGGWFAFYNQYGEPQDAIYWALTSNYDGTKTPCMPVGSPYFTGTLASFDNIPSTKKNYITTSVSANQTYRRVPDGGSWDVSVGAAPTLGSCNSVCATQPKVTCIGMAQVIVSGGTAPYTYLWDDPKIQRTARADSLCAGNYTVKVKDIAGNKATATVTIKNYEPEFVLTYPVEETTICIESQEITFNTNPSSSDIQYMGNGVNASKFNPLIAGVGKHQITAIYTDEYKCIGKDSVIINVEDVSVEIQKQQSILCHGDQTGILTAQPYNGTQPYAYLWNTIPSKTTSAVIGLSAGNYQVSVIDKYGCRADTSMLLSEPEPLKIEINAINETCLNSCNGRITIQLSGGVAPYYYNWSNGIKNMNSIENLCAGSYILTVRDTQDCILIDTTIIHTGTLIHSEFDYPPEYIILNESATFTYTGEGAVSYLWNFGDGQQTYENQPNHFYDTEGDYTVSLVVNSEAPNYCMDTISHQVTVMASSKVRIPNIFTPNGDGINETFTVESESMEKEEMLIYDRWGRLVYKWNTVGSEWNGKNKRGDDLAAGVYFYIYKGAGKDKIEHLLNGSITLVR